MRPRGAGSAPAIRMARVLLPRSRKPVSLFISFVAALAVLATTASPAMALSLNPDAGSAGIEAANTLHSILFIVIVAVIVVINLALLQAARPRSRAGSSPARKVSGGMLVLGIGVFAAGPGGSNTPPWILFVVVLLVVVLAILALLQRSREPRPGPRISQGKLAVGFGVFALLLFVAATTLSDKSRQVPEVNTELVADQVEGKPLEITATGQQWLWRFNYPNGAFSYRRLIVPADVAVRLRLVSTDVVHGWNVPELTGKAQAVPGYTTFLEFRAEDPATYTSRSSVLSGQGYDTMEIEVDVVPPAEYEAAIEALKTDIQDAQDKVEAEYQASLKVETAAKAEGEKLKAKTNKADTESANAK